MNTKSTGETPALNLSLERLAAYRQDTFLTGPGQRLHTKKQAADYVNARGYVYFWPVKEVTMPSLWTAVAGNRPVADGHDDPGHITWRWKDESLGSDIWYYAKVLRRRATFIAPAILPYFYALSENYGEPESDYLIQYEEGRMSVEAKTVYETLMTEGPLDTVLLRQTARLTSKASNAPFAHAMETLQADFKIVPVGVAETGAWKYAFIYDLVHRRYPDLAEQARPLRQADARARLAELYFRSVGAAQEKDLAKLFGWPKHELAATLDVLVGSGVVCAGAQLEETKGDWYALAELIS